MPVAIFDCNGVLLESRYLTDRLQEDYGVPSEESLKVLKETMPLVHVPDAPAIYSLWQQHLEEWDIPFSEDEFLQYWFSGEHPVPELIELVKKLKNKGWDLYVLSNNFRERTTYYRDEFEFLSLFDKQFFSWETDLVKPDPACFTHILESCGYKTGRMYLR